MVEIIKQYGYEKVIISWQTARRMPCIANNNNYTVSFDINVSSNVASERLRIQLKRYVFALMCEMAAVI